jgi:hypothetical protein
MAVRGQHGVSSAVVGAEQLVGSIQEVETHETDPTTEDAIDPWNTFQDEVGGLGARLKSTYEKVTAEGGPTEEEIKDAFGTLMGAWDKVAESVTTALRDPEVRQRLKDAASSFASALGTTIAELGSELRDSTEWVQTSPGGPEEE